MTLRFWNAVSGQMEPFRPAAAPVVDFLWKKPADGPKDAGAARQASFVGALMDVLVYFGYNLNQNTRAGENVDICCSEEELRPPPGCWLRLGGVEGNLPAGTAPSVWKYFCLRTPYRESLRISAASLHEAEIDLRRLQDLLNSLAATHGTAQAGSTGLAGYKKRFRDALCRDAGFPEALDVLWDGLRPGALSPASQLGLLREAESILGLGLDNARGGC